MSQCALIDIEASHPQIPTSFETDSGTAIPLANVLTVNGMVVANGTYAEPLFTTGSGNTVTINQQIGAAITGAPADTNDAGIVSFNDTQFTVDANGYVSLVGGGGATLNTLSGDDGEAVSADGAGNIDLFGLAVANATYAQPLYVDGDVGSNALNFSLQVAAAVPATPSDKNDAGICSFDQSTFSVTADGFVTLLSGPGVSSNTGDDGVAVFPTGAGDFGWLGQTVSNATHAKPVYFKDSATLNSLDLDVQVAAAVTGSPADFNDAGLASFNDTQFQVNGFGYVQLVGGNDLPAIQTITSDDPTAVGPDGGGDIDLTGEAVANATNAKPVFVDAGTNALNIEVQVAADITGAPIDKNDAGICSFDDTQFVVDANGYVTLVGGAGLPSIQTITSDDPTAVGPDASGNVDLTGEAVANATNAKPLFVDAGTNALNVEIQVAADITGAPLDNNDAGICSFDDTQFVVDANGYVTLVGGAGLPSIQTITSDDPTAVGPNGSGNVDLTGEAVANATNAKPVFVDAGVNALNIEVQVAADITGAPIDSNDAGLASFNDTQFVVDANGYTSLVGGSGLPAIQTLTSDDPTAVGPDANGDVDITGEAVANATNAKPVYVDAGTNALNIEVQVGAAITGAPADKNDAGIVSFDDTSFAVDANGYVTFTGYSFTWNEVTGTSQSAAVNNGYVCNNAGLVTVTLPSSAAFGDIVKLCGKGAGLWKIAQNSGQTIHFIDPAQDTTTGVTGSITATEQYATMELLCITATTDWVVQDCTGNFTIA